jgi:hypothetical protein
MTYNVTHIPRHDADDVIFNCTVSACSSVREPATNVVIVLAHYNEAAFDICLWSWRWRQALLPKTVSIHLHTMGPVKRGDWRRRQVDLPVFMAEVEGWGINLATRADFKDMMHFTGPAIDRYVKLVNKGRVSNAVLGYIVSDFDHLPPHTIFSNSVPMHWEDQALRAVPNVTSHNFTCLSM